MQENSSPGTPQSHPKLLHFQGEIYLLVSLNENALQCNSWPGTPRSARYKILRRNQSVFKSTGGGYLNVD